MDRQFDLFLSLYADNFDMIYNPEKCESDNKKYQMMQAIEHKAYGEFFGKGTVEDRQVSCGDCPLNDCPACTCG